MSINQLLKRFFIRKDKYLLIKSTLNYLFVFLKRKIYFPILRNPCYSKEFFKKYLKKYNYHPKKIKLLLQSSELFKFSEDGKQEKIIELIDDNFPNFREKVINQANDLLNNIFNIFGKKHVFGNKINWNCSFFPNKEWPINQSSKIDIYSPKKIADIKYNWEFNRHSFLVTLGLAYYFSKDELYAQKICDLILDWIESNPPLYNTSWIDELEVAMRLISWIFSLLLIKNSITLSLIKFNKIFRSMFQQAFYLSLKINKYAYNHTIGEAFGLFLFSSIFKELKIIKRWFKKSKNIFKKQIRMQILKDGVHIERSLNYHRFVLEFFLIFMIINPKDITNYEKTLVNKMLTFLRFSIKPDLSVPLLGDSDDARVIPPIFFNSKNNNHFVIELLNLGAVIFKRSDLKFLLEQLSPITVLLCGIEGYDKFKEIKRKEPQKKFHYFPDGGYFSARNNYQNNSNFLFIDLADFSPNGFHDHFDISNIIYSYSGKQILVDSGTYQYNISLALRNKFKSANAHNILNINVANKIKSNSTFSWSKFPKIYRKIDISKKKYFLEIKHNCFKHLNYSRKVSVTHNLNYLEILDILYRKKKTDKQLVVKIFFHFYKNIKLKVLGNEILINNVLKLSIETTPFLKFEIEKEEYFFSPNYGIKIRAPSINLRFEYDFKKHKELQIKTEIGPKSKLKNKNNTQE